MDKVFKSILYLGGFTTLGYVLMKVTEPSPEKIKAIRGSRYQDPQSDENLRKTELILKKLQEAAYSKDPAYVQKKEDDQK
jgi:hypothetical protein